MGRYKYYVETCKVWLTKEQETCNGKVRTNGRFHICQRCGVSYGMDKRRREYRNHHKPKQPDTNVRIAHDMEP